MAEGPMETERITLSQRERDRLKVVHEVQQKHLSQVPAAERVKGTDRQVRRMLLRTCEHGDGALVHGLRGRPSNRKLAARFEQKILALSFAKSLCPTLKGVPPAWWQLFGLGLQADSSTGDITHRKCDRASAGFQEKGFGSSEE
jgi:hypothetical protein